MHSVNGIDLQGSEYAALLALVEAERSGADAQAVAATALHRDGGPFDGRAVETYRGLFDAGLIDATPVWGGILFHGITQKGVDFVDDYAALRDAEESARRAQWAHDWRIAAFGVISGGLLGLVGGAFSSQLVSLLRSLFL